MISLHPGWVCTDMGGPNAEIATAAPDTLLQASPESNFHRARFRPNILVETEDSGLVENDWLEHDLKLGDVTCRVLDRKPRCVMTTHEQGSLSVDREVIRTIARINEGNAGIELDAIGSGQLKVGDAVRLLARRA